MWKNKFVEILFSNIPSKLNIAKAINLKYENMPSSLYKYKLFNSNSLNLLKTDKLYLSRPTEFNDPYDSASMMATEDLTSNYFREHMIEPIYNQIKQNYGGSEEELKKLKLKEDSELLHELAKLLIEKSETNSTQEEREKFIKKEEEKFKKGILDSGLRENMYISCFSETYRSILMWSHYANDHKGFCVEYNFKELGINHFINRFTFPVIYTNAVFDLKEYLPDSKKEFNDVLKEYMDGINEKDLGIHLSFPKKDDINKINNMFVFYNALIKSDEWEKEKEWRFVFVINVSGQKMNLKVPKPKSIYLGAKVSKENFEKVLKIGKERNINVYKMEIKPNDFALEPKLIHAYDVE